MKKSPIEFIIDEIVADHDLIARAAERLDIPVADLIVAAVRAAAKRQSKKERP